MTNIHLNQAIATLSDTESAEHTLIEIFAQIEEIKQENQQLKTKALSRKIELDKIKSQMIQGVVTDNFKLKYRDDRGVKQLVQKSSLDEGEVRIIILKEEDETNKPTKTIKRKKIKR